MEFRRHLEATLITEYEMGRLALIEDEVGYRLCDSLLPFLLIKHSVTEQSYLQKQLEEAREALEKLREQQARVIPADMKVETLEQENKALEKEVEGLRGDLRSANNYVRSLKGEASQLRKESQQKDEELAGVKQMRKEIAELQEAVYQLLTEPEHTPTCERYVFHADKSSTLTLDASYQFKEGTLVMWIISPSGEVLHYNEPTHKRSPLTWKKGFAAWYWNITWKTDMQAEQKQLLAP